MLLFGPESPGRSALAQALERRLFDAGFLVTRLDGPELRRSLSRDLDYTGDDHTESLRRAAEVARILSDAGLLCLCVFVAPWPAVREAARRIVGPDRFLSVSLAGAEASGAESDLALTLDSAPLSRHVEQIVDRLRARRLIDSRAGTSRTTPG